MKHIRNLASYLKKEKLDNQDDTTITISVLNAISNFIRRNNSKTITALLESFWKARDAISEARNNNPILNNALLYISKDTFKQHTISKAKTITLIRIQEAIRKIKESTNKISEISYHKIPKGGTILIHGHDQIIINSLVHAKNKGKKYQVITTECRPTNEGRKNAIALSKENIQLKIYIDGETTTALNHADIILIRAQTIGNEIIKCPAGTLTLIELAQIKNVPVYVYALSWMLDQTNETFKTRQQDTKILWNNPPKNTTINAPTHNIIPESLVTGIISDIGIFPPEIFREEVIKDSHANL